jgi:hypothetical protein
MRLPVSFLLAVALLPLARLACAQATADTLPEQVVAQVYDAINRCDRVAFYSLFAPVWYHSGMEDSSAPAVTRNTRDEVSRPAAPGTWFSSCKDSPPPAADGPVKATRQMVLGPYVVIEEAVRNGLYVLLDIYEVRQGKIVHEWESQNYSRWSRSPAGP